MWWTFSICGALCPLRAQKSARLVEDVFLAVNSNRYGKQKAKRTKRLLIGKQDTTRRRRERTAILALFSCCDGFRAQSPHNVLFVCLFVCLFDVTPRIMSRTPLVHHHHTEWCAVEAILRPVTAISTFFRWLAVVACCFVGWSIR